VPPVETVIDEPVAPLDHLIVPVQPVALIVALTAVHVTLVEDVNIGGATGVGTGNCTDILPGWLGQLPIAHDAV
jgi:hypothetical protein